jgi:acyl-coenzyme A thioesterase PaaI-like protein
MLINYRVVSKQFNSSSCFVCGLDNDFSLKAHFYNLENNKVAAYVYPNDKYQSYPQRMHGGIITSILDEVAGRAVQAMEPNTWGVTAKIDVRFIKPVSLDQTLIAVGSICGKISHLFIGESYLTTLGGTILARAKATFFRMKPQDISSTSFKCGSSIGILALPKATRPLGKLASANFFLLFT